VARNHVLRESLATVAAQHLEQARVLPLDVIGIGTAFRQSRHNVGAQRLVANCHCGRHHQISSLRDDAFYFSQLYSEPTNLHL
jgi:hypothetical protein